MMFAGRILKGMRRLKPIKAFVNGQGVCSIKLYSENSRTLKNILERYKDIELTPFHVKTTRFAQAFSNAQVYAFPYIVDEKKNLIDPQFVDQSETGNLTGFYLDCMSLFEKGIKEVECLVQENDLEQLTMEQKHIGSSTGRRGHLIKAVKTLDTFLRRLEYHQHCLSDMVEKTNVSYRYTELEITVLLANHLFSPLISSDPKDQVCVITNDSDFKYSFCPCANKCDAKFVYGDSGFGSKYLWFGKPGIMLLPNSGSSVLVFRTDQLEAGNYIQEQQEANNSHYYKTSIDMNGEATKLREDKNVQQIVSQAITFSLYQNMYQKESQIETPVITSLIPIIFASSTHFDLYLYDSINDVLLRNLGEPLPLFQKSKNKRQHFVESEFESKFDLNSVLQIWMMINHLILQPKLNEEQLCILRQSCGIQGELERLNLMDKIYDSLMMSSTCRFDDPLPMTNPSTMHKI